MLTFFERSPLDQVLKNDSVHKIQPSFQSPVKISGKSYREGPGEMPLGFLGAFSLRCLRGCTLPPPLPPWAPERQPNRASIAGERLPPDPCEQCVF